VPPPGLPGEHGAVPGRLGAWLLRPLVDLGPFETGPMYAAAVDHYWQAWVDPAAPRFLLQRILPHGFRRLMLREIGQAADDVADPRQRPPDRRTPRWQRLCDALDRFDATDDDERARLLLLLHALGFYALIAALPAGPRAPLAALSPSAVEALYWQASARYLLAMPADIGRYRDADLEVFEAIAEQAQQAPHMAFNAAVKTLVHGAKSGADAALLALRADRVARRLADVRAQLDPFWTTLLSSRHHRALAYLPMRRGDRAEVVRQMDLAEALALDVPAQGAAQTLMRRENLHPVLESRAKEAAWLGLTDLALQRAQAVIELDPCDPKSWLEKGELLMAGARWPEAAEAFVRAAILGPPAGAIARHMAGQCLRHSCQPALAALMYRDALEIDPLGVSPRSALAMMHDGPPFEALASWSGRRFEK